MSDRTIWIIICVLLVVNTVAIMLIANHLEKIAKHLGRIADRDR